MTIALASPIVIPFPARPATLGFKHVLSAAAFGSDALRSLFDVASAWKARPGVYAGALAGRTVVLLFEKPSLRTRLSFEIGASKLGAHVVYMDISKQRIGERESPEDYASNLSLWADAVVTRTYAHHTVEAMARASSVPVINGLSERHHPCQALADLLTMKERFGDLRGLKIAYVGDGNNVCDSLLIAGATVGADLMVICPPGYDPSPEAVRIASQRARASGAEIMITDEMEALHNRQVVYTDTWVSMGQDEEAAARQAVFAPYQINARAMSLAAPDAVFMHCLPAHRGHEVTDEVLDGPQSIALQQADNRLHAQNALLLHLLADPNA
ncbi:MAG: ornithine carbamoyltransferase [Phycisphaerales bacterium]|nr:ornithine carbamoyltransferase [Phycisphaerales bacterium]